MIIDDIRKDYRRIVRERGRLMTPDIRKISAKYYRQIKNRQKQDIFNLCEQLLNEGYTAIPFDWGYRLGSRFAKSDFRILESWLKEYVDDWSKCDDLCTHSLGVFIYEFPEMTAKTEKWAYSKNRWQRRASAVALIYGIRRRQGLKEIFTRADILLTDGDDMVQKGYGWMLKEAANHFRKEVFDYVMKHKRLMPRTALRYAIEKMPPSWKKRAMKKDW
jgi:3-methyladenine DNA glycosylase AlkD